MSGDPFNPTWPEYVRFSAGLSAFVAFVTSVMVFGPHLAPMAAIWTFVFVLMMFGRAMADACSYAWNRGFRGVLRDIKRKADRVVQAGLDAVSKPGDSIFVASRNLFVLLQLAIGALVLGIIAWTFWH